MASRPNIFTFYSFKGGVGRTMALMNCAYALAGKGKNVLAVDMDLEAPGLSHSLMAQGEVDFQSARDVIDLVAWARDLVQAKGSASAEIELVPSIAPDLHEFASPVKGNGLAALRPRLGDAGRLEFLLVHIERDYFQRLQALRLDSLSRRDLIRVSKVMRDYFKSRVIHREIPEYYGAAGSPEVSYDYVLVDSRTGLTEIGGLCVGPLADRLVVFAGLNTQNVQGTANFLKMIGLTTKARGKSANPYDEFDNLTSGQAPPTIGPKPTLLVASPVPSGETALKRQRRNKAGKALGPLGTALSYHPRVALVESVFVRDYREEYLASEYDVLANKLTAMVNDHPAQLVELSRRHWSGGEERHWSGGEDRASAIADVLRLTPHDPILGESLLQRLDDDLDAPRDDREFIALDQACRILSSEKASQPITALSHWGNLLASWVDPHDSGLTKRRQEAGIARHTRILKLKAASPDQKARALVGRGAAKQRAGDPPGAITDYKRVGKMRGLPKTLRAQNLNNWGAALSAQAKTKTGKEADRLFKLSYEKYKAALAIKPHLHEALNNWGSVLSDQAKTKTGKGAVRLFNLAYEKYKAALAIKPDKHEALNNWGNALSAQAKTKMGKEADRLLKLAYEKYNAALGVKPDKYEALNNWGNALLDQAKTKMGKEADRLFKLACEKYEGALAIKSDLHEALNNWGSALSHQGKTKTGKEVDRLFKLAYEKYKATLAIKPDKHEALSNWGATLTEQGKTKTGKEADRLLKLAYEKYKATLAIDPDDHEVLRNWGTALTNQAETKTGKEADRLFKLAYEKLKAALAINPADHEALNNWGGGLLIQVGKRSGEVRSNLLKRAHQKLLRAEAIAPGSGAYNLGCWAAATGKEAACRRWLEKAAAHGRLPARSKLQKDPDLSSVRKKQWFKDLLHKSRSKTS